MRGMEGFEGIGQMTRNTIAMTTDRHKFADAITLCNSKTLDVIDLL